MAPTDRHLVVDGSNIATEGRTLPSLAQLDEAVQAINAEYSYESLTVVVDATFAHRIDDSESDELEAAILAGEIVTPPAGAIGRGDAFILQVAEKVGAIVFSNDSFQEFHGEHEWLFDQGRLIGGKPIEGVGWIFVERAPVRGPASRRAVREAGGRSSGGGRGRGGSGGGGGGRGRSRSSSKKTSRTSPEASGPPPKPSKTNPPPKKAKAKGASKKGQAKAPAPEPKKPEPKKTGKKSANKSANKRANKSDASSDKGSSGRSRKGSGSTVELNDPITFVRFVSAYSIGDEVEGVVERFSSHGCYLRAAEALCYLPSRAMGDPPPTRARDVVSQGQSVIVTIESLDSDRRGINVVLVRAVAEDGKGKPSERNQDSGVDPNQDDNPAIASQEQDPAADSDGAQQGQLTRSSTNVATAKPARKRARKTAAKKAAKKRAVKTASKSTAKATSSARVKRATATKARKSPAAKPAGKKAAAKKTGAKKNAKKATSKATKKSPAKKTAKKATKKATAKKAPAKSTAKKTAKKTAAKKTTKKATRKATAKKSTKKAAAKKR